MIWRNYFLQYFFQEFRVHFIQKISVIAVFLVLSGFYASAEELWRLRYFVPTSSESEITRGSSKGTDKLNTSGHGGNLVFANGIGLGYSTVRTNGNLGGIDYKFKNHSLDLSYTIGDTLSLTVGAGRLIYGRGELSMNGTSYVTESSSGESLFMNFGIPFIGGELLMAYRQNNTEYQNYQSKISGKSVMLADSVKLLSGQISAGFGFLF